MRKVLLRAAVIATASFIALAACSSDDTPEETVPGADSATSTTATQDDMASASGSATPSDTETDGTAGAADLMVASTSLGDVVVDANGMTAYYFDKDTAGSGVSACTGDCLAAWPPILATSDTPVVEGVTGEVGTIPTPDGELQITINGMPIYLYAADAAPGDVTGQGVSDIWWVISPAGEKITSMPSATSGDGY